MAGLGRKTWSAGEVVTAANLQSYVQDQTVMKYANTSAVSSAVGTALSDGMQFFLTDTDETVYHNGTTFAKEGSSGNAIINGAFDHMQRATTPSTGIALAANTSSYTADRWLAQVGASEATTVSRQSVGDTTNLPNIRYCMRFQRNSGQTGTGATYVDYSLETADSIPFTGKTITVSFYARVGANFSATAGNFGMQIISGTGTDQNISTASGLAVLGNATPGAGANPSISTTWQRFNATVTVGATATQLFLRIFFTPTGTAGAADYFEITGVQLEAGSVATPFKRNAPSIQAELAVCQRYFDRRGDKAVNEMIGIGPNANASYSYPNIFPTVTMRTAPTVTFSAVSTFVVTDGTTTGSPTTITTDTSSPSAVSLAFILSGLALGRSSRIYRNGSAACFVDLSAEL